MKNNHTALLLIDLQNDFCKNGALEVSGAEEVIAVANHEMSLFETVIATQDWHPKNHASFASQHVEKKPGEVIELNGYAQTLWPDHCVQNTIGANFHPRLDAQKIHHVVKKGMDKNIDSYSAFYDNHHLTETGLTQWLREKNIDTLYVMGLATDYCVKYSCLDAITEGFSVYVIRAGCRGVNLHPDDSDNALKELQQKGCVIL